MPLTKDQLKKIEKVIRDRMLRFTYETVGEAPLTDAEIASLKEAGVIRGSVRHLTGEAYTIGKVVALMDKAEARDMGFTGIMKLAKERKFIETTAVEKQAMDWAATHTGQYIKGLTDDMIRDATTVASRAASTAIRAVQDEVISTIKNRKTISELKTALYDVLDDKGRDWLRIASTEMTSAIQQGIYAEIRENYGADQYVYKRPAADACPHCRRLYLKADGTPKIFKLSELTQSNIGRKVATWEATIGPVHPWCQCQLLVLPDGYGFVKNRVATEPFDDAGRNYSKGQRISEELFTSLSRDNKKKVGFDSVMEFTGEAVDPETRKSFGDSDIGLVDHDECCEY